MTQIYQKVHLNKYKYALQELSPMFLMKSGEKSSHGYFHSLKRHWRLLSVAATFVCSSAAAIKRTASVAANDRLHVGRGRWPTALLVWRALVLGREVPAQLAALPLALWPMSWAC